MDTIRLLESMGITFPSPLYIAGAILFGVIGMFFLWQGRKDKLPVPTWLGVALMFYPYVVWNTGLLYLVGAGLTVVAIVFREHKF